MTSSSSAKTLAHPGLSASSQPRPVGVLQERNARGEIMNSKRLYANEELIIGRDGNRCQYVIEDPVVSHKHLRIYSVVYDLDETTEVAPLVFAEDLSRNGTFWNNSLIGKGNGGFLLDDQDTLRVSARTVFVYRRLLPVGEEELFDLVQEREMKRFRRNYIVTDRVLGAGAFGRVHMAIEQTQRTQLACKIVDLRKLQNPQRMRIGRQEHPAAAEDVDNRLQLVKVKSWGQKRRKDNQLEEKLKIYHREAEILASLCHPNIVGLEKVYVTDNTLYIFQEMITAGDLFSYIELKNGELSDVESAVIVRQILVALEYLHEKNIVHRDLKPDNILMTTLAGGCRVVLTDFGCARRISTPQTRMPTVMGTYEYMAPEIFQDSDANLNKAGYTKAVDLWSLGCVTVVLLTGGHAFFEDDPGKYSVQLAARGELGPLEKSRAWRIVGVRPKAFVRRLLVPDERHRMTAKEALKHEWFTNDVHKTDFEELYLRATKHWRPRRPKLPVIELIDADNLKGFSFLQDVSHNIQKRRKRGVLVPIDPPYMPFPRRLNSNFFPKRKASPFNKMMTEEAKAAIRDKWAFDRSAGDRSGSSSGVDDVLLPCAPKIDQKEIRPTSRLATNTEKIKDTATVNVPTIPTPAKKQQFQPLQPRSTSMAAPSHKETEGNVNTQLPEDASSSLGASSELNREVFGPGVLGHASRPLDFISSSKAELGLPTTPATPRPHKTSKQFLNRVVRVAASDKLQANSDTTAEDSDKHEVLFSALREPYAKGKLRLGSLSHTSGKRHSVPSSNMKKRRGRSIFDLEEDAVYEGAMWEKKLKTDQEEISRGDQQDSVSRTPTNPPPQGDHFRALGHVPIPSRQVLKDNLYLPRI